MRCPSLSPALVRFLLVPTLVAGALVPALFVAAPAATAATTAPGASNTGVPDGTRLTVVYGSVVLNRAGATYTNLDIRGRVRVTAPNVTLANSIVRGDTAKVQGALIDCNYGNADHRNFVLRDSTINASTPSAYQFGIVGHDFTVLRSEITGTVDGVDVISGNVTVQQSWLHDFHYVSASQSPFGRETHNDGVQVLSGSNINIVGNTIYGARNAALQVSQDSGATSNLKFTGNWASGGGCTVNMSPQPRSSLAGPMTVTGNAFQHNTSVANCAIVQNRGVTIVHTNNIWRDTNTAVALTRGA